MYSAIAANKRNTVLIMFVFMGIIGVLGWIISMWYGEPRLLYLAFIVAAVYAFIQYYAASKLALTMQGAKEIQKRDNPRLYRKVENLTIATGMPMPKVYIIDDPAPNAFATGRDPRHSHIAVSQGLLDIMDDSELEAVLAHELGHIQNYDIRVTMIVFGLVSAIGFIADMLMYSMWFGGNREDRSPLVMVLGILAIILAPLIALMVQLAVSRQREYLADSTGALTTRYPEGLARALEKIGQAGSSMKRQHTSTAHLFFANPMKSSAMAKFFSTHPPIKDRVARLRAMGTKL